MKKRRERKRGDKNYYSLQQNPAEYVVVTPEVESCDKFWIGKVVSIVDDKLFNVDYLVNSNNKWKMDPLKSSNEVSVECVILFGEIFTKGMTLRKNILDKINNFFDA